VARARVERDHRAARIHLGEREADQVGDRGGAASPRCTIRMKSSAFGIGGSSSNY